MECIKPQTEECTTPLVSISCLAYNHGKFIRDCLNGFLMQKTDFPFEVLIHDDASQDDTADIIREYESKYPDIIKPIYQTENQYSKGNSISRKIQYPRAKGKYIAICEGDDYWTDPLKLQKQVDFLESHPDYSICGGGYLHLFQESNTLSDSEDFVRMMKKHPDGRIVTLNDFLNPYAFTALTVCLRREFTDKICELNLSSVDIIIFAVALEKGKGFVFPDIFGVYRKHQGGIWTGIKRKQQLLFDIKIAEELYALYKDKSKSIRNKCYLNKLELSFYDFKEHKKIFKFIFGTIRQVFSGKIRDFPARVAGLFLLISDYGSVYIKKN